jgi:dihydropteroate synthase
VTQPAGTLRWTTTRHDLTLYNPVVGGPATAPLQVLLMGIVNCTPDSFADGGRWADANTALRHCEQLLAEGADLLDIGGESTRPGAPAVPADEEWQRLQPVLQGAMTLGVPVSVDTCKAAVMERALALGVDIVNDITALREPEALAALAAHPRAGVCLMHMRGTPATMQTQAQYRDVTQEVGEHLASRLLACVQAGIAADRVALDPGYGFAKSAPQNWALLRHQGELQALQRPLLVGLSRKSLLGAATGRPVDERLPASVAAAVLALDRGAHVLRVHDVAATRDALRVWQQMRGHHTA